jgi:tRNA threonylcarbamoyladenosine biosynthesis protein TsaB
MLVLALDCATSACSAALWHDGQIMARRYAEMARGQSEALVPMIAQCLDQAAIELARVDLLAVTVGPGAFTGIRIGLATARALALATGKPLAGIASPLAVAAGVPRQDRTILSVLDSRREELWVQAFGPDLEPLGETLALAPAEIAARWANQPTVVAGDGGPLVLPLLPLAAPADAPQAADAATVAALAARLWPQGRTLSPEPLYMRPADVTMPACRST